MKAFWLDKFFNFYVNPTPVSEHSIELFMLPRRTLILKLCFSFLKLLSIIMCTTKLQCCVKSVQVYIWFRINVNFTQHFPVGENNNKENRVRHIHHFTICIYPSSCPAIVVLFSTLFTRDLKAYVCAACILYIMYNSNISQTSHFWLGRLS